MQARAVARTVMVAATALLGACAEDGSWQNASLPQEQWAQDQADCQRRARNQAERDFAVTEQSNRAVMSGGGGPTNSNSQWSSDMNRFSAQKRETRLFEDCMTTKGYTFVPDSQAAPDSGAKATSDTGAKAAPESGAKAAPDAPPQPAPQ